MELHDGDKVWLAFAVAEPDGTAKAFVHRGTVISAQHRIVETGGIVRAVYPFERVCECEAEGWQACAAMLGGFVSTIQQKIDECSRKAAQLQVGKAVPQ
jgi:hypothetical protein